MVIGAAIIHFVTSLAHVNAFATDFAQEFGWFAFLTGRFVRAISTVAVAIADFVSGQACAIDWALVEAGGTRWLGLCGAMTLILISWKAVDYAIAFFAFVNAFATVTAELIGSTILFAIHAPIADALELGMVAACAKLACVRLVDTISDVVCLVVDVAGTVMLWHANTIGVHHSIGTEAAFEAHGVDAVLGWLVAQVLACLRAGVAAVFEYLASLAHDRTAMLRAPVDIHTILRALHGVSGYSCAQTLAISAHIAGTRIVDTVFVVVIGALHSHRSALLENAVGVFDHCA